MIFATAHTIAEKDYKQTGIPMAVVQYPSGNFDAVTLWAALSENVRVIFTFPSQDHLDNCNMVYHRGHCEQDLHAALHSEHFPKV